MDTFAYKAYQPVKLAFKQIDKTKLKHMSDDNLTGKQQTDKTHPFSFNSYTLLTNNVDIYLLVSMYYNICIYH